MTKKAVFHLTFILFFTLLFSSLHSATITWVGGNSYWHTAANWDTGVVPDLGDEVIIPSGKVYVSGGQVARATSVFVDRNARLYVYNGNSLFLYGAVDQPGLSNFGRVYVYGAISVEHVTGTPLPGTTTNPGMGIQNTNYLYVASNGTLEVLYTDGFGILNTNDGYLNHRGITHMINPHCGVYNRGRFYNRGKIEVEYSVGILENGINDMSSFTNYSNGEIIISRGRYGVINNAGNSFTNYGDIDCLNNSSNGFRNEAVLTNQTGARIFIDGSGQDGFYNTPCKYC